MACLFRMSSWTRFRVPGPRRMQRFHRRVSRRNTAHGCHGMIGWFLGPEISGPGSLLSSSPLPGCGRGRFGLVPRERKGNDAIGPLHLPGSEVGVLGMGSWGFLERGDPESQEDDGAFRVTLIRSRVRAGIGSGGTTGRRRRAHRSGGRGPGRHRLRTRSPSRSAGMSRIPCWGPGRRRP